MKVKELIEKLKTFDPELEVGFEYDSSFYTLEESDIRKVNGEEESLRTQVGYIQCSEFLKVGGS